MSAKTTNDSDAINTARELAKQNIEQVKDAQQQFLNAMSQAQSMFINSSGIPENEASNAAEKAIEYSKTNMESGFELAKKLVDASDISEAMQLQNDYMKQQMEAYSKQANELLNVVAKADTKK